MTGATNAEDRIEYGIVLAGHGSRDPAGVRQFEGLVERVRERAPRRVVTHGFLEFATPTLDEALQANVEAGSRRVVMVPGVLLAATHAKNDLPSELRAAQARFPDRELHMAGVADLHPGLLAACRRRVIETEARATQDVPRAESCLVVVGRGTTDPDANSAVYKLARLVEEGMGFGRSFVCYSGTAKPLVRDGLRTAAGLGFRRLVVLPFFLFDGVLIKRIYAASQAARERFPEIEILDAGYLGPDPTVADVFLDRAEEAVHGGGKMNCSMCKYRVQVIGFEQNVGMPQRAHHGAVRGLSGRQDDPRPEAPRVSPYVPHPIEAESFARIQEGRDWSRFDADDRPLLQRLVHTTGCFDVADEIVLSPGAVRAGMLALVRGMRIVTDVTMVESGLKRSSLATLGVSTFCGVHAPEAAVLAEQHGITRSAAGIRIAFDRFGDEVLLAIGDAPTALLETVRLMREHAWRPQLVIGLPVGFVGTEESKQALRRCMYVPRITNQGTRGGSPWAAAAVNALMIQAVNHLAETAARELQQEAP